MSRELSHRIKNLFAVVDSLLHLSSRSDPAARPFVQGFRERLSGLGRAISFIHPAEGSAAASPTTMTGLIGAILEPYDRAGAEIQICGDDVEVGAEAVTSMAMVFNEMATNAVKYGALKDAGGRLLIRLSRVGDRLAVTWEEQGAVTPVTPAEPGFGTSLLDRTVRFQLSGTIERTYATQGLTVRLLLPLNRLSEA